MKQAKCDQCQGTEPLRGYDLLPFGWVTVKIEPADGRGAQTTAEVCSLSCGAAWLTERIEKAGAAAYRDAEDTAPTPVPGASGFPRLPSRSV